ncbi:MULTISPECIES: phosphate acetyltransferase [unclassified Corynebacterium]|uniref:phosphate acetyltransferase n=1 Tax=unclassified Corynebacterium TaxID=2624378 RepID=UPI0029CA6640|nr:MULTISPECIES: phosphate acetyltransferase [unclassified Corynebacterium]WPF65907.1 phosphate acetyltransferase [Corynebacterium sp. 22KM0430]WPF68400.1 phosphate acetyltransferase [Corynebacterium sp. 21KM1197]
MTQPRSFLLTAINRAFEGVDEEPWAAERGLRHLNIADQEQPTVAAVLATEPLAQGPALLRGTGNHLFDAQVAAALGVPVVALIDAPATHIDLAVAQMEEAGAVVARTITAGELAELAEVTAEAEPYMSAEVFESWLLGKAAEHKAHIVLPEGDDDRILRAAHALLAREVVRLTVLGKPEEIASRAAELGLDLQGAEIVDHETDPRAEDFAQEFAQLRKAKGVTVEQARETMRDISYFATMMVHTGQADGMVSGAAHTTAHTIKPAFQIIKTAPEASVVSSIFLMVMPGRLWAFGDCAVNPNPTAEQLGEIAVVSAKTAAQFGIDPRVAVLSYSTGTSGSGPDVERAVAATEHARTSAPHLKVDGPLQFDAAVDAAVAAKKMPDSPVAGQTNVFIFPDLEAGNIAYKTAQRTANALAVGPILQGLNKPINDLSRGATVADIVNTVAITAIQAGGK